MKHAVSTLRLLGGGVLSRSTVVLHDRLFFECDMVFFITLAYLWPPKTDPGASPNNLGTLTWPHMGPERVSEVGVWLI